MNNEIELSVVIPLYNKGRFIERTLNSIAIQQELVLEVIVVDDESTDDGPGLVNNYELLGDRLKLLSQSNRGASAARNLGIREASGQFIIFLDADDELLQGALSAYVTMIKQFPECAVFGLNFYIQRNGIRLEKRQLSIEQSTKFQKVNYFKGVASGDTYLTSSSTCVRRDVFGKVGQFKEGLIQREDPHMWLRIAEHFQLAFCNEPLVVYHQDDVARVCNTSRATEEFADSILLVELINQKRLNEEEINYARMIISSNYLTQALQNLREGNWSRARVCLAKTKWKFVHSKTNLISAYFLIYTGTWVFINSILKVRFAFLNIFGRGF